MTMFKKKSKFGPKKPWYREWSEALIVAVILALIIRTFLFQAFKIPSGSMLDTLLIGDHLLVNKFIYGTQLPGSDERYLAIRDPERGDVIVFEYPHDTDNPDLSFWQRKDYIKRIIGVPGDVVELRQKKVYVNGELFRIPQEVHKDSYTSQPASMCVFPFGSKRMCRDNMPEIIVPQNHYFVMGDNRDHSSDSRYWGYVPKTNIKGMAFIKYWSWDSQANWPRFERIGDMID